MNNFIENEMNREQDNIETQRSMKKNNERHNNMVNDSIKRDNDNDKVLVGIFETENEAIKVIRRLKENGYQENEIAVLAKDKEQMEHIDDRTNVETKTQSSSGNAHPIATVGAAIGGLASVLPALGLLLIPGIGPLLAAGPIAIILGGVVAGGVAGGLVGVLVQLGVNEADAKEYDKYIEQGKILVLVENRENLRQNVQTNFRENNSINADRSWQR